MRTSRQNRSRPAFTMVEILVVISLLGLLAAMAWPLIRSDTPQQQVQLGCDRLTSLMAMCRAQAMLLGHPVQLTWQTPDDSSSQILPVVLHEADPVGAPGEYQKMAASWANDPVLPNNVQIRLVQPGDFDLAGLAKTQGYFELPAEPSLQTVQFHPDGTADPAVFVLTTRLPEGSEQSELQGWVVLNAVSGLARVKKPSTPEQFEAMLKAQAALPDLQLAEKAIEVSETDSTGTAALLGSTGITEDGLADFIASLGANGASAADALREATAAKSGSTASSGTSTSAGGSASSGGGASAAGRNNNASTGGGAGSGSTSGGNRNGSAGGRNRGSNPPPAAGSGDEPDRNSGSGASNRPGRSNGNGSNVSNGDDPNDPNNRRGGRNTGIGGNRNTGGSRGARRSR